MKIIAQMCLNLKNSERKLLEQLLNPEIFLKNGIRSQEIISSLRETTVKHLEKYMIW